MVVDSDDLLGPIRSTRSMLDGPWATAGGAVRRVVRDGDDAYKLKCPGCGEWVDLDDDQRRGLVSTECPTEGCDFHRTYDYMGALRLLYGFIEPADGAGQ